MAKFSSLDDGLLFYKEKGLCFGLGNPSQWDSVPDEMEFEECIALVLLWTFRDNPQVMARLKVLHHSEWNNLFGEGGKFVPDGTPGYRVGLPILEFLMNNGWSWIYGGVISTNANTPEELRNALSQLPDEWKQKWPEDFEFRVLLTQGRDFAEVSVPWKLLATAIPKLKPQF